MKNKLEVVYIAFLSLVAGIALMYIIWSPMSYSQSLSIVREYSYIEIQDTTITIHGISAKVPADFYEACARLSDEYNIIIVN